MTHPDWWARVVQAFRGHEQPAIGQVSMAMAAIRRIDPPCGLSGVGQQQPHRACSRNQPELRDFPSREDGQRAHSYGGGPHISDRAAGEDEGSTRDGARRGRRHALDERPDQRL